MQVMMLCRLATTNHSAHVVKTMMSGVHLTALRSTKEPGGSVIIIIIIVIRIAALVNIIAIISLTEAAAVLYALILTSTETTTAQLEERNILE
ncbi:hypothetical protein BSL78_03438 [Apostichopus japonicus]|uniref:Uncharacterized protein n=1 Tax=Stichopus japonicus TaxID=307972 RepID=A0A2G8LHE5_STIJA|nr:hypothetical protein BSL78_03438 [Apostichopus japonicus]